MACVMIVGGTDSSGGAGLTRDTAMAATLGAQVKPVVTAVTVQTDEGLSHVHAVPANVVAAQAAAALSMGTVQAIKIGMLASAETAQRLADLRPDLPIVLDPVLKSTSGGTLGNKEAPPPLFQQVTLLTPNLDEAASLTGAPLAQTPDEIEQQAQQLLRRGVRAVLIKGGHGSGAQSIDRLFTPDGDAVFSAPRLPRGKRGSGCSLATAIAVYLARSESLPRACALARQDIQVWLSR